MILERKSIYIFLKKIIINCFNIWFFTCKRKNDFIKNTFMINVYF